MNELIKIDKIADYTDQQLLDANAFSYKQLLEARALVDQQIEDIQALRSIISEELLNRLRNENLNGKVVGEYIISRVKRITFKTKLEDARSFGAVTEAVYTKRLKELYSMGVPIPDVSETEYLLVKSALTEAEKESV